MTHTERLPEGWIKASLAEIALINPKNTERIPDDIEEVSFVPMASVEAGTGRLHTDETREWGAVKKGYKRFQDGDVLFAKITPCMENGKTALAQGLKGGVAAGSTEYHVLRPTVAVHDKLIMYYLLQESVRRDARAQMSGTAGQLRVPRSFLEERVLSLPPLPEQHRIVEAIESYLTRLDAAVALLERVQHNLKRYRAAVLKAAVEGRLVPTEAELARKEGRDYEPASELLKRILVERRKKWIENTAEKVRAKAEEKAHKAGKPWTHADDIKTLEKERAKAAKKYKEPAAPDTSNLPDLPEGWQYLSIEQFTTGEPNSIRRGPFGSTLRKEFFVPTGMKVYEQQHAIKDNFSLGHYYVSPEKFESLRAFEVKPGDIIMSCSGTIGKTAIMPEGAEPGIINQALLKLTLDQRIVLNPYFEVVFAALLQRAVAQSARGMAMQNLAGVKELKKLAFPIPPVEEQARILREVDRHESNTCASIDSTQRARIRCQKLRQSILKWAFEGKLVPQDPEDEPASVLLERIKAERESMQPRKRRRPSRQKKNEPTKQDKQLDLLEGSNT